MRTSLAGIGYSYPAGLVVDLPKEIADRYVARGLAERVEPATDAKSPAGPPPPPKTRKATSRKAKTAQKR